MAQQLQYDIVILGCGLVGLATARALPEHLRARTLLIDAQPQPPATPLLSPSQGARTTALNQRSLTLLDEWQCAESLSSHWAEIRTIEVSQQGYWGISLLEAAKDQRPLGAVVANDRLQQSLLASLQDTNSPELAYNTEIQHLEFHPHAVQISLSDGRLIETALLIIADGGASPWGARCGLQWRSKDYEQVAFTFNIQRDRPTSSIAYERFTELGSRALLPLRDHWQTVVWVTSAEQAPAVSTWEDTEWINAIYDCFGHSDGLIVQCSAAAQYPLRARWVSEQARPRLAVVGNGAITLHPIAGQGFNLHCRTVAELGRTLEQATDPGAAELLQQWQRQVHTDQTQIKGGCDGLLTLFAPWQPALAHARGLGLQSFNGLPLVPQWLKRRAMGWPS